MDLGKLADGLVKIALKSADTLGMMLKDELYDMHRKVRRIMGLEEKLEAGVDAGDAPSKSPEPPPPGPTGSGPA